jgi:hypothetical protein
VARTWEPSTHPRDRKGRFTRSGTRRIRTFEKQFAKAAAKVFKPAPIGDRAAGHAYLQQKSATPPKELADYIGGDWRDVDTALRAGQTPPGVDDIDAAMKPLDDDLMLRRHVNMTQFGDTPMSELAGMKLRDAAYASTTLDVPGDDGQVLPEGVATFHIAAPKGTPAAINAPDGEILLARDSQVAISRVEPDGRGGWDLYGILVPRDAADSKGKGKGEPAAGDGADQAADKPGETAKAAAAAEPDTAEPGKADAAADQPAAPRADKPATADQAADGPGTRCVPPCRTARAHRISYPPTR